VDRPPFGVAVGVAVEIEVAIEIEVEVEVGVGVGVGVAVAVGVGVGVGVAVGVGVGVAVGVESRSRGRGGVRVRAAEPHRQSAPKGGAASGNDEGRGRGASVRGKRPGQIGLQPPHEAELGRRGGEALDAPWMQRGLAGRRFRGASVRGKRPGQIGLQPPHELGAGGAAARRWTHRERNADYRDDVRMIPAYGAPRFSAWDA
jgi:hypothetical protein